MSDVDSLPLDLPITTWVEAARADPVAHRNRQITHMLLAAVGLTPALQETMLLKGGTLMMLAFDSPRGTQDVDFTVTADPEPFASELETRLNPALRRAATELGYLNLICKVQSVKRRPRLEMFEDADGPALSITLAHAERGSNEERRLNSGQAVRVLQVDLSFKEPVLFAADAQLERPAVAIKTYALSDLMGEKLRSLLQQPVRNRGRRQDVFDIAWLVDNSDIDDLVRAETLKALLEKSAARGINPTLDSIDDPEVARRAAQTWDTLQEELDTKLPPFEECFKKTRALYRSLPWQTADNPSQANLSREIAPE